MFVDDLVIPAVDQEEALQRLKKVLEVAAEYGLEINKKKAQVMQTRIEFLGHVVENGRLYPSQEKIKAVQRFPEPRCVKNIHSFLGLTGYFRKYVKDYALISKSLTDLLQKDKPFHFGEEEAKAFQKLKDVLSEEPVLLIYNPEYETELHTDASREGYGAILFQRSPEDRQLHPVYYMSRKTTPAEKQYSSYELEMLALIVAFRKFRVYLLGITFKIITDCQAFQKTMDKKDLSHKIAGWAMELETFKYTIEHRSGSRIKHVDALSRYPIMCTVLQDIIPRIKKAQGEDNKIKLILDILKENPYQHYFIQNDLLYFQQEGRDMLVIPKSMQDEII